MKLQKVFLFILILPVTLFFDLILYALVKTCPSCGNFWQWVETEGALSFPIVVGLTQYINHILTTYTSYKSQNVNLKTQKHNSKLKTSL